MLGAEKLNRRLRPEKNSGRLLDGGSIPPSPQQKPHDSAVNRGVAFLLNVVVLPRVVTVGVVCGCSEAR